MTIRFATSDETTLWNNHVLKNPDKGNVFQSFEFGEQKKLGGWKPLYILADTLAITVLQKYFLGLGYIWYIPKGPGISTTRQLDELLPAFKKFAKRQGAFAIKIEPELKKEPEILADLLKLGLVKVAAVQPNFSTVTVDLHGDAEAIMARLNQKGRHAIKRAERDGVTIKRVAPSDEHCEQMFTLLAETASGSFRIRDYEYYKSFWQRFSDAGMGQLFFAYVEGRLVAGAYALVYGKKSTYKDGASVRERTVYGASHLLQWNVILWAKEKSALVHDLCGAPPSDQIKNPDHPHYGIGRFKTSFNKEVTDYIGAYDIIIKPTQYKVWSTLGERIALRLYNYQHNESYY